MSESSAPGQNGGRLDSGRLTRGRGSALPQEPAGSTVLTELFGEPLPAPTVQLLTKLAPPPLPPGVVPRPHLLELLEQGADRALTLVVGATGFGKTTLLTQWTRMGSRPVAWLSLDEGDRDPLRLWTHVAATLARVMPEPRTLTAFEPPPEETAMLLLGELDERDGLPAALVLDDYDRLGHGPAQESLRHFVAHVPRLLQVVVASRVDPPFPLGLIRARGELLELRTADLKLNEIEARALVDSSAPHGLAPACRERLLELMEGWPAGLRAGADARTWRTSELLVRETLNSFDRATQRFLLHSAVLERLSGPLCDAVLARTGSGELLGRLQREGAFVIGPDEEQPWYRLHRGLAAGLRERLERLEPERVRELHRRAAVWHRRAREADAAITHALAAGWQTEAATILARTWHQHANDGTRGRALQRLDQLPPEMVDSDLRLTLARAWLCYLDGRPDEGEAGLLAAERAARSNRVRAHVGRQVDLVRGAVVWGHVDSALAAGRRALAAQREVTPEPLGAWAIGWPLWWRGELEKAEPLLMEAANGPPALACAATATLSRIAAARGDVDEATRLAEEADETARLHGLTNLPELGMVPTATGVALDARGDPARAQPFLELGLRLRRRWGHPLEIADGLIELAPVTASLEGRQRAATLLSEAGAICEECPDPGDLPRRLAQARRAALPRPSRAGRRDAGLSPRELAVLRLLARGHSKREIGDELHVSFNTVHSHTKSIYRKLGASDRAEALACARDLSLIAE